MKRVEKYSDLKAGLIVKYISKGYKTPKWVKIRLINEKHTHTYGSLWNAKCIPYISGTHFIILQREFNKTKIWYA